MPEAYGDQSAVHVMNQIHAMGWETEVHLIYDLRMDTWVSRPLPFLYREPIVVVDQSIYMFDNSWGDHPRWIEVIT
jgi:hypothetical protein